MAWTSASTNKGSGVAKRRGGGTCGGRGVLACPGQYEFFTSSGEIGRGGGILFVCRFLEVGNIFEVGAERGLTGKQNLALRHWLRCFVVYILSHVCCVLEKKHSCSNIHQCGVRDNDYLESEFTNNFRHKGRISVCEEWDGGYQRSAVVIYYFLK